MAEFKKQRGVALLLVLWVLALLSVIAAEFCRTMRTEVNIAYNYREMTDAYYVAVGGMNLALHQVLNKIILSARPPAKPSEEASGDDRDIVAWRINSDMPAIALGEGVVRLRVENEAGKVNINFAGGAALAMVLNGLGLSRQEKAVIVDSIQDWRDPDDFHRLNGAEEDYYRFLPTPYACKNDEFDSIDELLLVRGVTPEIYHGGLSQRVTVYPSKKTAGKLFGWRGDVKPFEDSFDFGKININAMAPAMLSAIANFDEAVVEAVVAYRREKDFQSDNDLVMVVGPQAYLSAMPFITWSLSPYYKVVSIGENETGRARQGVSALVRFDLYSREKYHIVQWTDQVGEDALTAGRRGD